MKRLLAGLSVFGFTELLCWHIYWLTNSHHGDRGLGEGWMMGHLAAVVLGVVVYINYRDWKDQP